MKKIGPVIWGLCLASFCLEGTAAPVGATGPSLTLGNSSMPGAQVNALHNPASGAYMRATYKGKRGLLGGANLSLGVEYGDIDDLFALIDDLAKRIDKGDSDDGASGEEPPTPENPIAGGEIIDWLPPDFDINDPDTQAAIKRIKNELGLAAALVAFVGAEGYSRINSSIDFPLLINQDILGGTVAVRLSAHLQGGAIGIADPFDFDEAQALAALEEIKALTPDSPETVFDLSAGLTVTINPADSKVSAHWDNDSTLLTKGARTYELAASYSRQLELSSTGQLYLGITPRLLRIGMSNVATRIGDLSNAEDLFNDITNRNLDYSYGLTADIGALWVGQHYRAGVTIKNLYPSQFEYPALEYNKIDRPQVLGKLAESRLYQLDTQGRLEGSWFNTGEQWQVNSTLETNAAQDAMGDLNQWFSLSLQYKPNITWLPAVRAGHHRNLKGTRLNYGAVGATLFKHFELDLGFTLDTVTIQGNDLPRGFNLNIGFNYSI